MIVPIDIVYRNKYETEPEAYIKKQFGVVKPVILIPCIKIGSCFSINGFRMHISGKKNKGKYILYKSAMELKLDYSDDLYVKKLGKYLEKYSYRKINNSDGLDNANNLRLFDLLAIKMRETVLSVEFESLAQKLNEHRKDFETLTVEKQCMILMEIIKILQCNAKTGNLKDIGIKSNGEIYENSKLTDIKSAKSIQIINQSVTGLYENAYTIM